MPWVRISDTWLDADEVEQLGADAVVLHLSALSYCARQGTDGRLPRGAIRRLWPVRDPDTTIATLQAAGEWCPEGDVWQLVNWREHLLARDEIEHRKQVSRESSERYRRHKAGDHSMCDRCTVVRFGDASRDASVTTSVTPPLLASTRLVSSRSDRDETEEGADPADAAAPLGHAGEEPWPDPVPQTRDRHQFYGPEDGACTLACGRPYSDPCHQRPAPEELL